MRITNNMLITNVTYNLGNNLERINTYQQQMATGKKVNRPSDDPIASTRILKFRSDLSRLESFESNAEDARSWMGITESAVDDVVQAVQRVRELLVQAANGVNTLSEKQKIADEIEELKSHIISDGNSNYAGSYIFSNMHTDKPLFKEDGSFNIPITQNSIDNPKPMLYEITVGEGMDVNTSPLDVFGYVEETNYLLQTMPDGTTIGPTSANKNGIFNLNTDFSGGAADDSTVDITVDGTVFTIQAAALTALDGSMTSLDPADIINLIKAADDGTNPLSSVADVTIEMDGTYASKTGAFDLNTDFSGGMGGDALVEIFVDGRRFIITPSELTALDGDNLPHDQDDIIDLINNASRGSESLSSVADVSFDESGNLVITSLLMGSSSSVEIVYNGDTLASNQTDPLEPMTSAYLEQAFGLASGAPAVLDGSLGYDIPELVITSKSTGSASTVAITYNGDSLAVDPLDPLEAMSSAFLEQAFGIPSTASNVLDGSQGYDETGTPGTKAVKSGAFQLDQSFTGGGSDDSSIDISIDGTTYTILSSNLTTLIATSDNPHDKTDILNLINNADDAGDGTGNKLSKVADVYFDRNNNLIVKSRQFGSSSSVEVTYNSDSSVVDPLDPLEAMSSAYMENAFGLTSGVANVLDGSLGVDKTDAMVMDMSKLMTDADILENAQDYLDNSFMITLNGESKEIQIDSGATLASVSDFETALNTAITKAFPGPEVVATAIETPPSSGAYYFQFTTANQVNNGEPVELQVETIKATQSKLISDLNNIINGLRADESPDEITTYIGLIDDDLNRVITSETNIGARVNRIELVITRISANNLTYTSLLSDAQDVDMAEAIMLFQNAQNVYKASLSTGAQAIQPTLIDFIR